MKKYEDKSGNSGVIAYDIGRNWIRVKFRSGEDYKYSYSKAGQEHVEKMKDLAAEGEGLSGYISQHVSDLYD